MSRLSRFAAVLLIGTASFARAEEPPPAATPAPQDVEWAQSWWMPRHEQKLEARDAADYRIVLIGDSITHGWEQEAAAAVWKDHFGGIPTFNLGFSGDRTEHVIWRVRNGELEGLSPELAVVMIGTNNTASRRDTPAQTAEGIRVLLDDIHQRLPEAEILLLAIFPRGSDADDPLRKANEVINERIVGFAEAPHITFHDIGAVFLQPDGRLKVDLMPDLLHPNEAGYLAWAEAMQPLAEPLLEDDESEK